MRARFAVLQASAVLAVAGIALSCSWDNPIWPKDARSTTALFRFVVDGKAGYIDRTGRVAIGPKFEADGNHGFDDFFEGVAFVGLFSSKPAILADIAGEELNLQQGLLRVEVQRGNRRLMGYANRQGRLQIRAQFDGAAEFSEGLAAVGDGNRWGFADRTGAVKIPLRFAGAGSFHEGLARVQVGQGWGFVDRGGTMLIRPRYVWAGDFADGAALVGEQYERVWFIDRAGNTLFGREFRRASGFRLGLAHVFDGRKYEYIDRAGRTVFAYQERAVR
ncbi:MAG: WG repeat-containing protein [Acidobacteria bacterium]|nr:WG repeat-containing protein [Acidobacteriota bacterium]